MLEHDVTALRITASSCTASTPSAQLTLDTDPDARQDAFNSTELLLAALSASILKGIEQVSPILKFKFRNTAVHLHAWQQEMPPKITRIEYTLWVDTDEHQHHLDLMHDYVKQHGTVFNTLSSACNVSGSLQRGMPVPHPARP